VPKILEHLVGQLEAKGKPKANAYAIATSALQKSGNLKPGSQEATAKGKARGEMTPATRAKDRQAKYSGGKPSDYKYSSKDNQARKK
jgi:hypothetical protein